MRVATSASEKAWTVPPLFSARSVSLRRPSSSSQALAPSMNIHRTPFSGRNFECYSEDGFLSGRFGAATVHGARSKGVITFVKHFALNDQETMRTTVATLSNEQAIREVYLAAFEPSVSGGDEGTLGIMLIMNRVGLVWSGDHRGLVTNVVRGEWGFDGVVITDQASYPQAFPLLAIRAGLGAGTDLWLNSGTDNWQIDGYTSNSTVMCQLREASRQFELFGWMAVVLGAGDSFHLVPRALALCTAGLDSFAFQLGLGKWITSLTMTVFYVLLYYVWRERYEVKGQKSLTVAVYTLSVARVILCMMPQNQWLTDRSPLIWGIYRNVPFALLGILVIVLFYRSAKERGDKAFGWMWLTIVLSFGFYIPVVLWAEAVPMIGMLMIPKTCAYVWTVMIGNNAMKKELRK